MNLDVINKILGENWDLSDLFKRNVVKEYLQVLVLSFIYSDKNCQDLIFYGGSCLRHCFDLPRLSEDLDFVDLKKRVDMEKFGEGIKNFFKKEIDIEPKIKIQKFRIYLKFPILYDLKLTKIPETNLLNIKIEIYKEFNFCHGYRIEIIPLFKFGNSVLVKTFDMPSLMSTKIRAILNRKWEKTDKNGKMLAAVKGRDYFDLMWYLGKNIRPNFKCIYDNEMKGKDVKEELLKIIEIIDEKSISFDLEGLIKDPVFLKDLAKSLKGILIREIREKL